MPTASATVATIACSQAQAEQAVATADFSTVSDSPAVLAATETASGWQLQLYCDAAPDARLLAALAALAPESPAPEVIVLADTDWVSLSQAGLEPVEIGRFHIHTGTAPGTLQPGQWPVRIDAGLAFGTGQHATTGGCIAMANSIVKKLDKRNILDVGTGSGILSLCARRLFPRARLTATDIDSVAVRVARENARLNAAPPGQRAGHIAFACAVGARHPLITRRQPYDLVFANILAGPLLMLAPVLSQLVAPGGHLILAGLLWPQAPAIVAAYRARGLALVRRSGHPEWPTLLFQRRNIVP